MEVLIPDDDPVRLLNAFVEELELSDLYQSYGKIKSSQVTREFDTFFLTTYLIHLLNKPYSAYFFVNIFVLIYSIL